MSKKKTVIITISFIVSVVSVSLVLSYYQTYRTFTSLGDILAYAAGTFLGLSDVPSSYSGQGGKVVKVNTGETALEFGTASGGTDVPILMTTFPLAGYYHTTPVKLSSFSGAGSISASRLYAIPFPVGRTTTFDRIAVDVTTLAASGEVRLGIYSSTNGAPGALVLDAGTIDPTSTGVKEITISQELTAGNLYWLALLANCGPSLRQVAGSNVPVGLFGVPAINASDMPQPFCWRVCNYGALPDPWGTIGYTGTNQAGIWLRSTGD